MGIGGSTASRPGSAESALVVGQQPPRPGGSACCPHFRRNHAPADRSSLDRDIDEIVAAVDPHPDARPTLQEDVPEVDYKELEDSNHMENPPLVDYAKFKNLNHKGSTIAPSGRLIQHQESDLLWRLGLVSPEAYKMSPGPRSAPSSQGPCLKTPSYDLTEEQLMATIEKEFEVAISPHR